MISLINKLLFNKYQALIKKFAILLNLNKKAFIAYITLLILKKLILILSILFY